MTFALVRKSCLNINQKYIHLLTESHFIMSKINPSSSLSVILNMRWSSSRMTLSRGTLKNGSAWHPGCLDHELSSFLAMVSLWKYSHECDILHLQHKEMEYVRYRLKLLLPSKNNLLFMFWVYYGLLFERTVLYLSCLWSLHQMQLLFAVAPFMPMAYCLQTSAIFSYCLDSWDHYSVWIYARTPHKSPGCVAALWAMVYWPRSFFAFLGTSTSSRSMKTQKRTWPISSHLDLTLGQ